MSSCCLWDPGGVALGSRPVHGSAGAPIVRAAIVLTRPEGALKGTARGLRDVGIRWPILFSPILQIVPVAPPDLPDGDLVFTSGHAVARARALQLQDRPAIAVGAATAAIARVAGFECATGPGDVEALCHYLSARADGPILHLHGRHVTSDLAAALRQAGRAAQSRVVYDQIAQDLTDAARSGLGHPDTILPLYSPRSARRIAAQIDTGDFAARVVAISISVAEAWPLRGSIHIAKRPDGRAMMAEMASLVAAKGER